MLVPILDEHLIGLTRKLKDHLIRYGAPAAYFDHSEFDKDVSALPFLRAWHDLLTPYFMMVTDSAPSRRAFDPSDIIDFMHSMYMPYCTVWRSDRYFAGLVAPVAQRLGCRVVPRLVDLPGVLTDLSKMDSTAV